MFFLLNDRVFLISGGAELVAKAGLPVNFATQAKFPETIIAMQTAFFDNPNFTKDDPIKAAALCWLINSRSKANSAIFIPSSQKMKSPSQVAYRLATTNITTLGSLKALQDDNRLSSKIINESVWSKLAA